MEATSSNNIVEHTFVVQSWISSQMSFLPLNTIFLAKQICFLHLRMKEMLDVIRLISNTRKSVWIHDEMLFWVFDTASQTIHIILGEIQSKSAQNFMLIKIQYPNHRHGGDFLVFSLWVISKFEKMLHQKSDGIQISLSPNVIR